MPENKALIEGKVFTFIWMVQVKLIIVGEKTYLKLPNNFNPNKDLLSQIEFRKIQPNHLYK